MLVINVLKRKSRKMPSALLGNPAISCKAVRKDTFPPVSSVPRRCPYIRSKCNHLFKQKNLFDQQNELLYEPSSHSPNNYTIVLYRSNQRFQFNYPWYNHQFEFPRDGNRWKLFILSKRIYVYIYIFL